MTINFWEKILPPTEPEYDASPLAPVNRPLHQLALQFAAVFTVLSVAWPYFLLRNEVLPWAQTTLSIGAVGLLMATLTKQAWWWRVIHAVFMPLVWGVSALAIAPGWFLLAFVLLLLIYRGAVTEQVPLYLSNRETAAALADLVVQQKKLNFLDLGAGLASVIHPLSIARPEVQFTGVENAPATWFLGYLRTRSLRNCRWLMQDMWRCPLGEYDVVYAFLSPAPMLSLWEKIQQEMPLGSLFISNSFPIPQVTPNQIIELNDKRQTRLYCYQR